MTLKEYKDRLGLSSKDLAMQLGIHQSRVCNYLSGKNAPALPTALTIQERTGGAVTVSSWALDAADRS